MQHNDMTEGSAPSGPAARLEPSASEMRWLADAVLDRVIAYIESLPDQPAADTDGALQIARSLREPLPHKPTELAELLHILFDVAVPKSFNAAGPGYLAYIPGGGIFHAALAGLIADSVNRYIGVFSAAPALSQLEANVLHWFAELIGYPATARGILTSGGSLANFAAIVTARTERLTDDLRLGTLYASEQAHSSVVKAARLAGFPPENVRLVCCDSKFRICVAALGMQIAADREAGKQPFLLVANAGSTAAGAVDPLVELAELARREALWFHVDAAYGGFFMLTERGRSVMRGIDLADSVVLDPHKSLFLPYGTGALLVRDAQALRRAHSLPAEYLPAMQEDGEFVDFCEISPELSRPFRGLGVWLPFKLLGSEPFRAALDEKLDLTRWLADELRRLPGIQIVAEPELSLFAFAVSMPGETLEELNRLTRRLLDRVNSRQRIHLSGAMLGERFAVRVCILSFRTHSDRVREAAEIIRAEVASLRPGPTPAS